MVIKTTQVLVSGFKNSDSVVVGWDKDFLPSQALAVQPLVSAIGRQRQISEFQASLVYKNGFQDSLATQGNLTSNKQTKSFPIV